jgi:hypothetical protein
MLLLLLLLALLWGVRWLFALHGHLTDACCQISSALSVYSMHRDTLCIFGWCGCVLGGGGGRGVKKVKETYSSPTCLSLPQWHYPSTVSIYIAGEIIYTKEPHQICSCQPLDLPSFVGVTTD